MKDKIVQQVVDKFNQRSELGIKKYGTTLEQNNTDDFLNHLQEELMDAILYIQKIKSMEISDEEIEEASKQINYGGGSMGWIKDAFKNGAKWYKEKLKSCQ